MTISTLTPHLCPGCHRPLPVPDEPSNGNFPLFFHGLCEDCARTEMEKRKKAQEVRERRQWERRWLQLCPERYRQTVPGHLPQSHLRQVLGWKDNPHGIGLFIHGATGRGKTRCVWLLLQRLIVEEALSVLAMNETEFSHECSQRFASGNADEWIRHLCSVRVLFLDDVGTSSVTERYRHELYHVIEQRTAWCRPLIVTTSLTGDHLAQRIGGETGNAILRRLREFCQVIHFS